MFKYTHRKYVFLLLLFSGSRHTPTNHSSTYCVSAQRLPCV